MINLLDSDRLMLRNKEGMDDFFPVFILLSFNTNTIRKILKYQFCRRADFIVLREIIR